MKLIIEGPDRKVEKINTLLRSFKGISRTLEGKKTDDYVPAPTVTVSSSAAVTASNPRREDAKRELKNS